MIGYATLLWAVLSGVCFYACLLHLQVGLRKPFDRLHLLFGVFAATAMLALFGNTQLATAQTPEQYLRAIWFTSVVFPILYGLVGWCVALFANQKSLIVPAAVSLLYVIVLIGNLLQPYSMLMNGPPTLTVHTYPWGETVTRSATPLNPWIRTLWLSHVVLIAYLGYSCADLFRRGPRRRAWWLLVSAGPFAIALTLNLFVYFGVFRIPYTAAFGIFALTVMMSTALTREWRSIARQMQVVLDNVPAAVYLKNIDGRYRFVNRYFERMHRLPLGGAIGKTDLQLFDSIKAAQHRELDQRALTQRQPIETEIVVPHDGLPRTYASLQFPLLGEDGAAYALCGIATDISDRKAASDVLRDASATLERRVARRTDELAQLNKELEAFAYSVSHDLRAPLMTVHGFADLLMRDHAPTLDQSAQKYVHRIRDGAKRMTGLIDDLLSLSRVTREPPQRSLCNLSSLAQESLRALRETNPQRQVETHIAPDLQAHADMRLMSVVLNNLLSNAWKYTGKSANARIEVGSLRQNDATVYFVRDNGAGFNPQYVDRLFQPFKRLHSEQDFPGNGIGLATVARIVHRHGGRIWAEGKPQEGATFYFTIPVADEDISTPTQRQTASA